MIEKTLKFNVLDVEDVEKAVSEVVGRSVEINEIAICLIDCVPLDSVENGEVSDCCMACEVYVDDEEVYSDDDYEGPLDNFMPTIPYVDVKYIFNFSVKKFKSFERYTDSSD